MCDLGWGLGDAQPRATVPPSATHRRLDLPRAESLLAPDFAHDSLLPAAAVVKRAPVSRPH